MLLTLKLDELRYMMEGIKIGGDVGGGGGGGGGGMEDGGKRPPWR